MLGVHSGALAQPSDLAVESIFPVMSHDFEPVSHHFEEIDGA